MCIHSVRTRTPRRAPSFLAGARLFSSAHSVADLRCDAARSGASGSRPSGRLAQLVAT
jgi:hypothetical protein